VSPAVWGEGGGRRGSLFCVHIEQIEYAQKGKEILRWCCVEGEKKHVAMEGKSFRRRNLSASPKGPASYRIKAVLERGQRLQRRPPQKNPQQPLCPGKTKNEDEGVKRPG